MGIVVEVGIESRIVHFNGNDKSSAVVKQTTFEEFMEGRALCLHRIYDRKEMRSVDEICKRATDMIGSNFGGYSLLTNNCDDFVRYCMFKEKALGSETMTSPSFESGQVGSTLTKLSGKSPLYLFEDVELIADNVVNILPVPPST